MLLAIINSNETDVLASAFILGSATHNFDPGLAIANAVHIGYHSNASLAQVVPDASTFVHKGGMSIGIYEDLTQPQPPSDDERPRRSLCQTFEAAADGAVRSHRLWVPSAGGLSCTQCVGVAGASLGGPSLNADAHRMHRLSSLIFSDLG